MRPRATLEQWLTLIEVDKAGSIQAAAKQLHKSHTTLIYAIKKLEQLLDVSLVQIKGRRAVLTEDGKSLLRRAVPMLEQASDLEAISAQLSKGMESEITVTIDHLCDREWLYRPLTKFAANNKGTSVQIRETSLSGTLDAVKGQQSDIAIINVPVADHLAEAFGVVTMIPVVSRTHSLAQKSSIGIADLLIETQIVVRDLGKSEFVDKQDAGWLKSQHRITVDNFDYALKAVKSGLGYGRIPAHMLTEADSTQLVQLPLQGGGRYQVPIHIVLPKTGQTGPAAMELYKLLVTDANNRVRSE